MSKYQLKVRQRWMEADMWSTQYQRQTQGILIPSIPVSFDEIHVNIISLKMTLVFL